MAADLSVIMNVHDEVGYFTRTMQSTEAAAQLAVLRGGQLELVIVMDRPTPQMAALVGRYKPINFVGYRIVEVDHGSLGPARNAGIDAATGTYVALCDGDDLVSQNAFAVGLETIRGHGPGSVVFPEYVFAFGDSHFINHYAGSELVTALRFLSLNPFPSRIMAARSLLRTTPFADVSTGSGYVYEDWLLNTELLAAGVSFAVAPQTILFYRKHQRSLSTATSSISTRQIPPSRLFEPEVFLRLAAPAMQGLISVDELAAEGQDFLTSTACREALQAANRIDPMVDIQRCLSAPLLAIASTPTDAAQAYFRLCTAVEHTASYIDIVLTGRHASRQHTEALCNVLRSMGTGLAEQRTLVLAEDPEDLTDWSAQLANLPAGSRTVAVQSMSEQHLNDDDVDLLCLKLVQAMGPRVRVHVGNSSFGRRFWLKFGRLLQHHHAVLHRFDAEYQVIDGLEVRVDEDFVLLSDMNDTFHTIVAHNAPMMELDLACLDIGFDKWLQVSAVPRWAGRARALRARLSSEGPIVASPRRLEPVGEHRPEKRRRHWRRR